MSRKNLTFTFGRVLLALILIAFGYQMLTNGFIYYEKYVHAVRKMLVPESLPSHKPFGLSFTYDQLIIYLIKADAILFILSGLSIIANQKKEGALLLILATLFVLATKDNPFLESNLKSIKSEAGQRQFDFLKHLSVLGSALLLLSAH